MPYCGGNGANRVALQRAFIRSWTCEMPVPCFKGRALRLPVTDVDTVVVRYDSALDLMHDLRGMGAGNALIGEKRPLSRGILWRANEVYTDRFADPDGRLRATFNTIWLSGWAPHASQQKPLKPGSATTSLDETLQEIEKSRADKPG